VQEQSQPTPDTPSRPRRRVTSSLQWIRGEAAERQDSRRP